ncbi:MAG: hypothetical protein ACRELX_08320, partial [Longimicrobiales bacterium]
EHELHRPRRIVQQLSLVAVLGMAVAIAIGAGYYAGFGAFLDPELPLDEGDRVVGLRYRGVTRPGDDAAVSVHDSSPGGGRCAPSVIWARPARSAAT